MIESMATGTPVVATAMGAAPEVIVDGVTGYVPTETVLADPVAEETAPAESGWQSYALYTLDAVNMERTPAPKER